LHVYSELAVAPSWPKGRQGFFSHSIMEGALGSERKRELRRQRQRRRKRLKHRKKVAVYEAGKKRASEAQPVEAEAQE
jgi:hypothetical protein